MVSIEGGSCCIFIVFWIIFGIGGPLNNRWLNDSEKKYLEDRIRIRMKAILLVMKIISIIYFRAENEQLLSQEFSFLIQYTPLFCVISHLPSLLQL